MKKRIAKKEAAENIPSGNDLLHEEDYPARLNDEDSIAEFLRIKKLQNQILEKMLEKISHPGPKKLNQNRKIK